MSPAPEEWDSLRLAATAADRTKAAEKLRPAFEKRLNELGYPPRAIAHAFSALKGPDTVSDALAQLARYARSERSRPVPLDFERVEQDPSLRVGHSVTITGVERDDHGIHIRYTIGPPLPPHVGDPRGVARDDHDHEYENLGSAFGLAEPVDRTTGVLTMPLPQQRASLLRVRISRSKDSTSVWEHPAYELRVAL
jgi:hypothetical protein